MSSAADSRLRSFGAAGFAPMSSTPPAFASSGPSQVHSAGLGNEGEVEGLVAGQEGEEGRVRKEDEGGKEGVAVPKAPRATRKRAVTVASAAAVKDGVVEGAGRGRKSSTTKKSTSKTTKKASSKAAKSTTVKRRTKSVVESGETQGAGAAQEPEGGEGGATKRRTRKA